MEYLDGMDLKTRLERYGTMQWAELVPIVRALLPALDLLHSHNLIHRDISPDNIFLTREGGVRLIDFGSVRTYQGTRSFTTFMKHNFAPWEQYQSHGKQGPWTDLYALNVTLYYALTGVLPPKAPDRQLKDTVRPLGELCPQLPRYVATAIQTGMAVSIQARYSNVRSYAQALFPNQPVFPTGCGGRCATGDTPSAAAKSSGTQGCCLVCCSGILKGKSWSLRPGVSLRIGRQPSCEIRYPLDAPGVSGRHCTVMMDAQRRILVRDDGSSYGTRLGASVLKPGVWYRMAPGSVLVLAQEQYRIQ